MAFSCAIWCTTGLGPISAPATISGSGIPLSCALCDKRGTCRSQIVDKPLARCAGLVLLGARCAGLVLVGELADLFHPGAAHLQSLACLLGSFLVSGSLSGRQLIFQLRKRLLELCGGTFSPRPRLGVGPLPLFLLGSAYCVDNCAQSALHLAHVFTRNFPSFIPALLHRAQARTRLLQIFNRQERLGFG